MRAILMTSAILAAFPLLAPTASYAQQYPWCAQYGGLGGGGRNCGFVSYGQCLAAVHGVGGFCERNPFYAGPERSVRRPKAPRD